MPQPETPTARVTEESRPVTGNMTTATYCEAKGCAALPARAHLEAHAHWGCTSPEQMKELIDAVTVEARNASLAEAEQAIRTTELPEDHIDLFDNGADWAADLVHGLIAAASAPGGE